MSKRHPKTKLLALQELLANGPTASAQASRTLRVARRTIQRWMLHLVSTAQACKLEWWTRDGRRCLWTKWRRSP